jgi:signal peptidase II
MPPELESPSTAVPLRPAGEAPVMARPASLAWWLIAGVVVADQLTKWMVLAYIPLFDSVTVLPDMVDFVHVQNAGVAFGIMNDMSHPWRSAITTGLALAALGGIVFYARQLRQEERMARIGLSLIVAGAAGNLIDRFRFGYVIDFVDVYHGDWHFWAFNVADAAISCGAAFVLLELLFTSRNASHSV